MFAAIDLGSNSFRLSIGISTENGIKILKAAREPVQLGLGIDANGNLTPIAMQRALSCLSRFSLILKELPLSAVRIVATNTMRKAKNIKDFLPLAQEQIGYPIEVISGYEEGSLIYKGISNLIKNEEKRLVIDIGGGSTEIILGEGKEIINIKSFDIGTVGIARKFFSQNKIITKQNFKDAISYANQLFKRKLSNFNVLLWSESYGSSGTMRTLAHLIEKNSFGDGFLSKESLISLQDIIVKRGTLKDNGFNGIKEERFSIVLGGLSILLSLHNEINLGRINPCVAGLRMGILTDLENNIKDKNIPNSSVKELINKYIENKEKSLRAEYNVQKLYGQFNFKKEIIFKILGWAAKLHEVGCIISKSGYHKHGAYLIHNSELSEFTSYEKNLLSVFILSQKGNLKKINHLLKSEKFITAVMSMRLAVLFTNFFINVDTIKINFFKKSFNLSSNNKAFNADESFMQALTKEKMLWQEFGIELNILPSKLESQNTYTK